MTVDQISTILQMEERSVERFSYSTRVVGVEVETTGRGFWLIPSQGRDFDQQRKIAEVLVAFGAISDWGVESDMTLRVWI